MQSRCDQEEAFAAATRYLGGGKLVRFAQQKGKNHKHVLSISCPYSPHCGERRKAGGWHAWGQNGQSNF